MLQMSKLLNKSALVATGAALLLLAGGSPAFAKVKTPKADTSSESTTSDGKDDGYQPPLPNEVLVSDRDFNQFVFPSAISNGPIFPAGSPLVGKPVYLAGNTQVLIQVQTGSEKPFNMIVELDNGAVYKFYLKPRPINGITKRVDGATERGSKARAAVTEEAQASAPRGADVELLKQAVAGNVPAGFDPIDLPALTRFDKFSVIPLAGWSDGAGRRIMSFSLVAVPGQTAVVAPPQFYRAGITAVTVDGDTVDATHTPTLYVVEEFTPDEQ